MERLTIRCGSCVGAIKPEDMGTQGILRKLAEYEDLEEKGRLYVEVYMIDYHPEDGEDIYVCSVLAKVKDLRKDLHFLIREEAEVALEKMKGEEHE